MKQWLLGATLALGTLTACGTLETPPVETLGSGVAGVIAHKVTYADGSPVFGAVVYDELTNQRLAITDASGLASHRARPGQRLRITEPNYGQQQAIIVVTRDMLGFGVQLQRGRPTVPTPTEWNIQRPLG